MTSHWAITAYSVITMLDISCVCVLSTPCIDEIDCILVCFIFDVTSEPIKCCDNQWNNLSSIHVGSFCRVVTNQLLRNNANFLLIIPDKRTRYTICMTVNNVVCMYTYIYVHIPPVFIHVHA